MILFLALCFVGIAVGGATALVIFWPLALVHIRDRHPELAAELGANAFFKVRAWIWLLRAGYRRTVDPNLSGLATPARISLLVIIGALLAASLLWLVSVWTGG
ncbi:hypothetical protein [Cognatilysobacter lacus]|uniref:Transmembrane protein n=1 Tax=Cognatilysobacter lacus TaxID=1643323 RepID=A0A5D8Z6X6_9GAMM|nr:hypothetical protein [Lysobacter lacus]TZF90539.1 hypothetical protein FW784_04850 [Lysobacter lacus]